MAALCTQYRPPSFPVAGLNTLLTRGGELALACTSTEDPPVLLELLQNSSLAVDDGIAVQVRTAITRLVWSGGYTVAGQVSPQRMRLEMRLGVEQTVRLEVARARQYPVDLYYLMDLSNSMSDDRENVVRLGGDLADALRAITPDYRHVHQEWLVSCLLHSWKRIRSMKMK